MITNALERVSRFFYSPEPEPGTLPVIKDEPIVEPLPDDVKLPTSKEELQTIIKSAVNKASTSMLKNLGVTSIKEFKTMKEQLQAEKTSNIDKIKLLEQERDTTKQAFEQMSQKYSSLEENLIVQKFNIKDEYKQDLVTLAKTQVTETKKLEAVLQEMVAGKYKYAITMPANIKVGTEKTKVEDLTEVQKYLEKYKGTPYYK